MVSGWTRVLSYKISHVLIRCNEFVYGANLQYLAFSTTLIKTPIIYPLSLTLNSRKTAKNAENASCFLLSFFAELIRDTKFLSSPKLQSRSNTTIFLKTKIRYLLSVTPNTRKTAKTRNVVLINFRVTDKRKRIEVFENIVVFDLLYNFAEDRYLVSLIILAENDWCFNKLCQVREIREFSLISYLINGRR